LDATFIQESPTQKEPKWHQKGRSNTRHHWAKPKVGNIARSFLWGLIGEVENRHGAVLNSLEIEIWLSEQEAKGHDIEYICREAFYARNGGIDQGSFLEPGGDLDATL